ncbi:hypothetical protein V5O48_011110 [Marasmius crinis-equi]|uniref:Nephrocystin 3-like N-terminal domain-containing protein n=1 Tax=Marasmius crinis-equi TaxID=585013 RepID=A0ABR3F6K4_9AGAR
MSSVAERSTLSPNNIPGDDVSTNRDPGTSRTSITIDSVRPNGKPKTRVKHFVLVMTFNGNEISRTPWDSREGSWNTHLRIWPGNPVHIELHRTPFLSFLAIRETRIAYGTLDCNDFEEAVLSERKVLRLIFGEIRKDITLTHGGYVSDGLPLTFNITVVSSPVEPEPLEPHSDNAATVDGVRAIPQIVVSDDQGQSATLMGVCGTRSANSSSISPTRPPTPHKAELAPPDAHPINVTSDDQGSTTSVKDVYGSQNASASLISLVPTSPPTPSSHLDTISSYSGIAQSAGDNGGKVLTAIKPIADFLDRLVKVHPIAEVTWLVCSSAYKVVLAQHQRDQEIVDLYDEMIEAYECATKEDTLNRVSEISVLFDAMIDQSTDCCMFIANYSSNGYLKRLLGNIDASQKIQFFREAFRQLKTNFNDAQIRMTAVMMQDVSHVLVKLRPRIEYIDRSETLKVLSTKKLRPRTACLPNTRQETLRKVIDWTMQGKESIMWISGVAGCGKSSVMATLHKYLVGLPRSRLAAFIRFDRLELDNPSVFVCTLAHQLAMFDSRIGASVARVVETRPQISDHSSLSEQFRALVHGPLIVENAIRDEGPIVVLVDGFDECMEESEGSDYFQQLLALLSDPKTFEDFPFLRFIVASRPESPIHHKFHGQKHIHHFPLDITSDEASADIHYYLSLQFERLCERNPEFRRVCTPTDIHSLSKRASGLFIWAVTVFRFLRTHPTEKRLREVLALTPPRDAVTALTDLYTTILSFLFKESRAVRELVCAVFGFVLALKALRSDLHPEHPTDPSLTPLVLSGLLSNTGYDVNAENILPFLSKLASIIPGDLGHDQPIIFLHKSFDDFLLDPERSKDYHINPSEWERRFAGACVSTVHLNILRAEPEYGSAFRFANYYWLITSIKVSNGINDVPYVMDMLSRHLLRWLYFVRVDTAERLPKNGLDLDQDLRNILMICRDGMDWQLMSIRTVEGLKLKSGSISDIRVARSPEEQKETITQHVMEYKELLKQLKELFAFLSRDLSLTELFQTFFHFLCHQSCSSPLYKLYVPQFIQWANGSASFEQINRDPQLWRLPTYQDEIVYQDIEVVGFQPNVPECFGCDCYRYSGSSAGHQEWEDEGCHTNHRTNPIQSLKRRLDEYDDWEFDRGEIAIDESGSVFWRKLKD